MRLTRNSYEVCMNFLTTLDKFKITSDSTKDSNYISEDILYSYWIGKGVEADE